VFELAPPLFAGDDGDASRPHEPSRKRRKQEKPSNEIPHDEDAVMEAAEYGQLFRAGYIKLQQRAGWRCRRLGAGLKHPAMPRKHRDLELETWRLFDILESLGNRLAELLVEGAGLSNSVIWDHARDPREPLSREGVSASPFDIFYYPNTLSIEVPNCVPHFDPGFLSLAPCSRQSGLLVLDPSTESWLPIDTLLEPGRDMIAFAGESLEVATQGAYLACSHAVARGIGGRCSIVYELQTCTGKAIPVPREGRRVQAGGPGWLELDGARVAHAD